jgi:PTH1 family peptidyl-tRNA hydrolase
MKLVVGLGNPGEKYTKTRHNVGFLLLDKYIEEKKLTWNMEKKFKAEVVRIGDVMYAKPQTFMNKSGESVAKMLEYFKLEPTDLYVVHDDVDLEFTQVKHHLGRGSAGHKGVQNIMDILKTDDFWRIRVGVGRPENPNIDTDDWVLTNFSEDEFNNIQEQDIKLESFREIP